MLKPFTDFPPTSEPILDVIKYNEHLCHDVTIQSMIPDKKLRSKTP